MIRNCGKPFILWASARTASSQFFFKYLDKLFLASNQTDLQEREKTIQYIIDQNLFALLAGAQVGFKYITVSQINRLLLELKLKYQPAPESTTNKSDDNNTSRRNKNNNNIP